MLDMAGGAVGGVVEIGQDIIYQHVAHKKHSAMRHHAFPAVHQLGMAQIMRVTSVGVVINGLISVGNADVLEIALVVVKVKGRGCRVIGGRIAGTSTDWIPYSIVVF